jgi:hypothetical protein
MNLTAHGLGNIYTQVIRTARSLYRCRLSCGDAFPSPDLKEEWTRDVWREACAWEEAREEAFLRVDLLNKNDVAGLFFCHVARAHMDFQFVNGGMRFLTNIKMKIKQVVEFWYGFDSSRAPESISHNASRAQALLAQMTFVYRVRPISSPFVNH